MKTVTTAACVCALLALLLFPAFAVLGMVLGLVVVARGKLSHGIALLAISACCGCLGLALDLPYGDLLWRTVTNTARMVAQASVGSETPEWHIVSLQSQVTKGGAQSVCSWKLVVRNDSSDAAVFHGNIEFQDANGVKLFDGGLTADRTAQVPAESAAVFTGSRTISSSKKVARAVPNIMMGS